MADEVVTSRDGAVLTITLNRPDVYNAINRALHEKLAGALREASNIDAFQQQRHLGGR